MKFDLFTQLFADADIAKAALANFSIIEQLFDHIPDTVFFLKDRQGRYLVVNQTLVERCGLNEKREMLNRHVVEIFPKELAAQYAAQDQEVLGQGTRIIDRLELHWRERRRAGWCLTTKLPMKDEQGKIIGLVGISRDLRAPGNHETIPASLAATMEYLDSHYDEAVSPASLAKHAGLTPIRFARLTKRIFRLTPHQLIVQTRINAAARLLAESQNAVAQIAVDCGFYDHSAFARAFRSATGLTPTQFREIRK